MSISCPAYNSDISNNSQDGQERIRGGVEGTEVVGCKEKVLSPHKERVNMGSTTGRENMKRTTRFCGSHVTKRK
jgi:hypothetical protein